MTRTGEDGRADEQHVVAADLIDQRPQDRGAERAAQTGAAADEAEEPLGLPRVVDLVGQRPELADEKHTEQQAERVEADRHPDGAGSQQGPEDDRAARRWPSCVIGMTRRRGSRRTALLYQCISTPMNRPTASWTNGWLSAPS